ncbi:hypothetical protein CAFE_28700 [Caprobacter fermentans]|uniref:Uncharacterized protein n=1 Tax=Caproicibacter fermentans TaxID=2576756 RepID=A0A6N8I2H3_9FIRM|nr:hypothetical protein [Caproicibacter fermentans]MVB12138.1 hypothetical protein [Caproicibacter fermentans]OCN01210.1 hypothetical protein A7X67_07520 [Clostridium sp. W14A]QNK39568.1 hypothetical protein HCR03_12560 [Caproicibacter fermentans]
MEDLSSMLNDILKNPESMEKIKNLAGMLGGGTGPPPSSPSGGAPLPAVQDNRTPDGLDQDSMRMIMKLAPMISKFRQEDDSTRLLRSLRPFLNEDKRKKLDEAIRLMQIVRMLPLIRGSGLL